MSITDNELVTIFRKILQAECGIKLTQDEASILANTLTDFFQVLTLIEHKKQCPKKDELEKFLKQKWGNKDKDEQIIIPIPRSYIQELAEARYGRKLTEAELEELTWLAWEEFWYLDEWLDKAMSQIVPEEEIAKHREQMSKEFHEIKGGNHD